MTPALAGWIVLGVFCGAALIVMFAGAFQLVRAQRELNAKLAQLEATQRRALNPERFQAALSRMWRDAASATELVERAQRALSTIAVAMRYCVVAVRIVRFLA